MTTETTFPVRNVPPIVYNTNLSDTNVKEPYANVSSNVFTDVSAYELSRHADLFIGEHSHKPKSNQKPVTFLPSNENEYVAISATSISGDKQFIIPTFEEKREKTIPKNKPILSKKHEKDMDDYIFQLYVGSISVIGLLLLFRFIQKN